MYINGLNVRPVRDVEIPTEEINAIEGIQIVPGFKCITGSECQKLYNTPQLIKVYYRSAYNWNTTKDNITTFIY